MSASAQPFNAPVDCPVEIVLHGRGGQGAKTCGDVLTLALYLAGYKPHGQPRYTADRMGAPVYYGIRLREDNAPIFDRSWIRHPCLVAVLDDSLIGLLRLGEDWQPGITVLVNMPESQLLPGGLAPFRSFRLDASRIAGECGLMKGNTPILSSVMAGALARVAGWIDLEHVEQALQRMGRAAMGNLQEANLQALHCGYQAVAPVVDSGETRRRPLARPGGAAGAPVAGRYPNRREEYGC